MIVIITANAQEQSTCSTTPSQNAIGIIPGTNGSWFNTSGPYTVKIYIHIIRRSDGTGGQTLQDVSKALELLYKDFYEHNIYFVRDCEIDYIDKNEHYNNNDICEDRYDAIFNDKPHDDGIDVYLFPDDNGFSGENDPSCGWAADIPSMAFYVTGTYWGTPAVSLVKSHILTHEMGHCIGLWHTHDYQQSEPEFVNGSNCITGGDFVCDTNADPDMGWTVVHPDCEWNGSGSDVNGDPYDPDEKNIMSYSNPSCMDSFTVGQGKRMRQMIAFSPILQSSLVDEPEYFGQIISVNTIWTVDNTPNNGNVLIVSNLIISCNATLTIEEGVSVQFKPENKLIITQGASLVLEGTLTSENSTWQGVEVWGNKHESQYALGGVTRAHGRFAGGNGSIVENAKTAVKLYGPNYNDAGGQISCIGTIFRNNTRAVDFAPYANFWPYPTPQQGQPRSYFGQFTSCKFENNNDYAHEEGFDSFLYLLGVDGVSIRGCDFINTQTFPSGCDPDEEIEVADYGHGIFSTDSKFSVQVKCTGILCENPEYSTFSGLGYGVHASTTLTNKPFFVKQVDFSNCYFGLKSKGASNGTLLFNNFNLGNVPDPCVNNGEQLGVFFETDINGFTMQQNNFMGESGNVPTTVGTHCKNIKGFNNVIRKNNYINLTFGNVAQGQNAAHPALGTVDRGLRYLCNVNTNVSNADFGVVEDPNTNGNRIRHSQGLEVEDNEGNITYHAAGNEFSYGAGYDFINEGDAIDYYYYAGVANQEPLQYIGIDIDDSNENTCPEDYCEPPCKTKLELIPIMDGYYQDKDGEIDSKELWKQGIESGNTELVKQSKKSASYYRRQMDQSAYMVVQHLLYDTTDFNPNTLAIWLDNLDIFGMDMTLALKAQSEGNHTLANSYLVKAGQRSDLNPQQQVDLQNMPVLLSVLNEKSPYALDKSDLQQLEQVSNQDLGWTGSMTRNILGLYGYRFAPSYHLPKVDEKSKVSSPDSTPLVKSGITVFPNPNTGTFSFVWQPKNTELPEATLSIRNISGRVIHIQGILPFESNKIDLKGSPHGVYFYQLRIEGAVPQEGKLIIQ